MSKEFDDPKVIQDKRGMNVNGYKEISNILILIIFG